MSETSLNKTRRKFISLLKDNHWTWQYSVFFDHHPESLNIVENTNTINSAVRKAYPDIAFLYRIVAKSISVDFVSGEPEGAKMVTAPYLTFFTSEKIQFTPLMQLIHKSLERKDVQVSGSENIKGVRLKLREVKDLKVSSYASSVKNQQPHDLNKLLDRNKVNRFGVLNRSKLILRADKLNEELIPYELYMDL
jgi:hypothetical protein